MDRWQDRGMAVTMSGWNDRWLDRKKKGYFTELMGGWLDALMDDVPMDCWGRAGGWMDGWLDRWITEQMMTAG